METGLAAGVGPNEITRTGGLCCMLKAKPEPLAGEPGTAGEEDKDNIEPELDDDDDDDKDKEDDDDDIVKRA